MARFFIDNQEIAVPVDCSSLNQVLNHIENAHLSPSAAIRQIQVDGLPLMPISEEIADLFNEIQMQGKVEIFTDSITEIVHDSIAEAMEYLDRVEAAIPSLCISFQTSPGPEDFEKLKQLYEGLYWLNHLLDKLKANFQIGLEDLLIQGTSATEHCRKFILVQKQLIESRERGDFVLISDFLESEVLPLVPVWSEMFRIVSGKVDTAQ